MIVYLFTAELASELGLQDSLVLLLTAGEPLDVRFSLLPVVFVVCCRKSALHIHQVGGRYFAQYALDSDPQGRNTPCSRCVSNPSCAAFGPEGSVHAELSRRDEQVMQPHPKIESAP